METMISQVFGGAPVAVEAGTQEVVRRIAPALEQEGIEWYIGGSAAAWLQGAPIRPHDLDLGTTRAGVDRIAGLLREYLIEPLAPTDWAGSVIARGARAFVGTFKEGIRAEWWVPLAPQEAQPLEEWSGQSGVARLESVRFHGYTVRATRPEYAIVRAAEKGRTQTAVALLGWLRERGPDRGLLGTLLERSKLSSADRARLLRAIST
jgi:hypothetical protein